MSSSASYCFNPRLRPPNRPSQAATEGKICALSLRALNEPELARFFFRIAKQEFFDAVHLRQDVQHRLTGLVADEFGLVVTREDIEQLGTVRSKNCFVLAAVQAIDSLTHRLGIVGSHAIVNHFNTLVMMRNREAETAALAFLSLGNRREHRVSGRTRDSHYGLKIFDPPRRPSYVEVPVCPIGTLARLSPHQAFVLFADGSRTETPVWFIP